MFGKNKDMVRKARLFDRILNIVRSFDGEDFIEDSSRSKMQEINEQSSPKGKGKKLSNDMSYNLEMFLRKSCKNDCSLCSHCQNELKKIVGV